MRLSRIHPPEPTATASSTAAATSSAAWPTKSTAGSTTRPAKSIAAHQTAQSDGDLSVYVSAIRLCLLLKLLDALLQLVLAKSRQPVRLALRATHCKGV